MQRVIQQGAALIMALVMAVETMGTTLSVNGGQPITAEVGELVFVPVIAIDVNDLAGFQFGLEFDGGSLNLDAIILGHFSEENYWIVRGRDGQILDPTAEMEQIISKANSDSAIPTLIWAHDGPGSETLSEALLMSLVFTAVQPSTAFSEVALVNTMLSDSGDFGTSEPAVIPAEVQNAMVTVLGDEPLPPDLVAGTLTVSIADVSAPPQTSVKVPVTVRDFSDVAGMQFGLSWGSDLSFQGVQDFGLPGLTAGSFGTSQTDSGSLTLSWDDPNGASSSLPDGAVLFTLAFTSNGVHGSTEHISVANTLAIEAFDSNIEPLEVAFQEGSVSVIEQVAVSGRVTLADNGGAVADVAVAIAGDNSATLQTDAAGQFGPAMLVPGSYTVTPSFDADSPATNGVSTLDLALMRRHILQLRELESPYALLAADVNGSDSLTTADIALTRRFILGNADSLPAGLWRFAPAAHVIVDPSAPWSTPRGVVLSNIVQDSQADFVAIKLGDVNASRNSTQFIGVARSASALVALEVGSRTVTAGSHVVVPVTVRNFQGITSVQCGITWDSAVLSYTGVQGLNLPGLALGSFGSTDAASGMIRLSWDDPNAAGVDVADGGVLFELVFDVVGPAGASSAVSVGGGPISVELTRDFLEVATDLVAGQIEVAHEADAGLRISSASPAADSPVVVAEDGRLGLEVTAAGGTGPYAYSWTFDGQGIGAGNPLVWAPGYNWVQHPARQAQGSIACRVTDADGAVSDVAWPATVIDVDRAPETPSILVSPTQPTTVDDLVLSIQQSDPDGDTIDYDISWQILGARSVFPGETLGAEHTRKGEVWEARVRALTNPYGNPIYAGDYVSASVTIANSAPVAQDQQVFGADGQISLLLRATDSDMAERTDSLRYAIKTQPENGMLIGLDSETGEVLYQPVSGGSDQFTFSVTDTSGAEDIGTVAISSEGWIVDMQVVNATVSEISLGMVPGALDGPDSGDRFAPGGDLQFVMDGSPFGFSTDYREPAEDASWHLLVDAGNSADAVILKWNIHDLPGAGLFLTPLDADGQPLLAETRSMSRQNRIIVEPGAVAAFQIRLGHFAIDLEVGAGWQGIGLPFGPLNTDVSLGGVVSDTLGFDVTTGSYVTPSVLAPYAGYQVFNPGATRSVQLAGKAVQDPFGTIGQGWNLISVALPPGDTVLLSEFRQAKPGVAPVVWEFVDGDYRQAHTLRAGAAYWVYRQAN